MQDDKNDGGDEKVTEKSDFENPGAEKDEISIEGQICDVEVLILFIFLKVCLCFYFDLCHSILLQDDKNDCGEGKGSENFDFDHSGAGKNEKFVESQVYDVEVHFSTKECFLFSFVHFPIVSKCGNRICYFYIQFIITESISISNKFTYLFK